MHTWNMYSLLFARYMQDTHVEYIGAISTIHAGARAISTMHAGKRAIFTMHAGKRAVFYDARR